MVRRATPYVSGSVVSRDGTTIGYRQLGSGPGLIIVHGGMMAAQGFMKLGAALSKTFTVTIPDRRGRGKSGPFGEGYGIDKERDDLGALIEETSARFVFGLSSGAIIALHSALTLPIDRLAIYEPPLLLIGGTRHNRWVPRYEREIAKGKLASAMVTLVQATGDPSLMNALPRLLLTPLFKMALKADAKEVREGDVRLKDLIPTMGLDAQIVAETAGALERFKAVRSKVLLLGGGKSAPYLHDALDALAVVLPKAKRIELSEVGHLAATNGGKPHLVAEKLLDFFAVK